MAIYYYDKPNDDGYRRTLEVREGRLGDRLVFDTAPRGSDPAAMLPREDVARLRDALTTWLGDGETESTPAPVDPEMVRSIAREIVQDELRRIQVQGTVPLKARPLTPEEMHSNVLLGETVENIWGAPCATCGHSTGVHLPDQGCMHPDGCECAWPDTSAPVLSRTPAELADEVYAEIGPIPVPEPASAPGCECGHPKNSHSGAFQGCDAWVSRGQVCSCTGYTP